MLYYQRESDYFKLKRYIELTRSLDELFYIKFETVDQRISKSLGLDQKEVTVRQREPDKLVMIVKFNVSYTDDGEGRTLPKPTVLPDGVIVYTFITGSWYESFDDMTKFLLTDLAYINSLDVNFAEEIAKGVLPKLKEFGRKLASLVKRYW